MTHCQRPDREASGILCGHPLPCPYHTVVIDTTGAVPTVTIPVAGTAPPIKKKTLKALKQISQIIHKGRKK